MKLSDILGRPLTADALLDEVAERKRAAYNKQVDKIRFIQRHFPDFVDRKIALAERAMEGRHILPGTRLEPYFVGDPPRWHDNPVGDDEFVWQLNRMGHWRHLSLAYALSGEERFADKVLAEMDDWIATCPCPDLKTVNFKGVGPWRALEVGYRMFETWPFVLDFLLQSREMDGERFARYCISVYEHASVLSKISPELWPDGDHSYYVSQMLGLLAAGCNFPELRDAQAWRHQAQEELERSAEIQLTTEGGQIEGCPHYHNQCAYFFLLALVVGRKRGVHFSEDYHERVENMLSYSLHAMRPSGTIVPWGDSDADPYAATVAGLYGWLALHRDAPLRMITNFVGRRFMRDMILRHLRHVVDITVVLEMIQQGVQPHEHLPLVSWQRELKQVALRTSWRRDALSVFFANRVPVMNGHAHIDPMSFDFTGLGQALVVDPGRYTYREGADRYAFKSAAWHNTLTIDGADPFPYVSSFDLGPQGRGSIKRVEEAPSFIALEAEHNCYHPAIHRRVLAVLDQRLLLIIDRVEGVADDSSVQIHFHIDCPQVGEIDGGNGVTSEGDRARLALFATSNLVPHLHPGKVSRRMDHARPSTRVVFEDSIRGRSDRIYATLLAPFAPDAAVPRLDNLHLEQAEAGWEVGFEIDRVAYRFDWFAKAFELHRL